MSDPKFLSVEDVLDFHREVLEDGEPSDIRDETELLSALAQPYTTFSGEYLHVDLFEVAAAYLFHIAQNQPFINGNKRTAVACTIAFLAWNDIQVDNDEQGLVDITLAITDHSKDKIDVADFFRSIAEE